MAFMTHHFICFYDIPDLQLAGLLNKPVQYIHQLHKIHFPMFDASKHLPLPDMIEVFTELIILGIAETQHRLETDPKV